MVPYRYVSIKVQAVNLLLCIILQAEKGSPVKPVMQEHTGEWLSTIHCAFKPHEPGQGSLHLIFVHARFAEQSELTRHSGLQFGGRPT